MSNYSDLPGSIVFNIQLTNFAGNCKVLLPLTVFIKDNLKWARFQSMYHLVPLYQFFFVFLEPKIPFFLPNFIGNTLTK